MKITSVYITKNEEKNIEKSILSYKDIADEIIIVDTGSTDNTIEICKNLGCKIYNFEWCNDFSKARNYAISLCSNELILFLDSDEYFSPSLQAKDKEKIISWFSTNKFDILGFYETDIDKDTKKIIHTSYVHKMFRNSKDVYYSGTIHETLHHKNRLSKVWITDELQLIHTGYSQNISDNKIKRNLELLNAIDNKKTMDYYYLARENLALKNYEDADKNLDIFFKAKDFKKIVHSTNIGYLAYTYKQCIMMTLKQKYNNSDILKLLMTAKREFPYIPECYFNLGEYYLNLDLKKSLKYLKKAIKTNEEFVGIHFELNNFLQYQPKIYYYMAKIYLTQGYINDSIQKIIVACMLDKKNRQYLGLLLHLLNRNKTEENIDLLYKVYKPKIKEDYEIIVEGLANTNLYKEFIHFATICNNNFKSGNDSIYYAMMITGNYNSILESLKKFKNNKSSLIMIITLLFSNSPKLLQKYFDELPNEYIEIIELLSKNKTKKKVNMDILTDVIAKLINYGVKDIPDNIWSYIIENSNVKQFKKIISVYNNNSMYEQSLEILSKKMKLKNFDLDEVLIYEYLFVIYKLKKYELFIFEYDKKLNCLKNKSLQLALLKNIDNKLLEKSVKRKKNKLLRKIKNAKI